MDIMFALTVIKESKPKLIVSSDTINGDVHIHIKKEDLIEFATFLKTDSRLEFDMLSDLFGADFPKRPERVEIIYNFYSQDKEVKKAIDDFEIHTLDLTTGEETNIKYKKAKIIDMVGFVQGLKGNKVF